MSYAHYKGLARVTDVAGTPGPRFTETPRAFPSFSVRTFSCTARQKVRNRKGEYTHALEAGMALSILHGKVTTDKE